ncbi:MAG: GHKL domain-containing protein [Candidatus Fonsibacter sp.]|jgi:two-component system phosphate regulon sensor histidine kinase PhoR|nr:GHKL domain-containing protein [Candidatus Fonsibacter sp.]
MIYLIGAIAILANIFFYIFLKFSLWILFFNILIFFIFIILIKSHKEYQNLESKKKLITNYNTELGKNDLERLFIDKIEDGIIILNVFNVIIYANKSASNNFGEKLEGKHISAAVRISDLLDKIDQHREDKKIRIVNVEIKNPLFKFYKTTISNIQSEQILLVFKDFTEVQKSQLIRSDFIANVSHNLKTPLVSIKGFLETIEDSAKDDPLSQKKFIEIMKLEANKMETLIEDLLTLSRIEQQEHILINNKVNIKKIIEDVVVLISKRIKKKKISLKVDLDEDQKFVIGDPEKLSILFLNLIDNAIKFSNPLKTIEIKILKVDEIFKKFISISIIDEGIGINEEDIHRITERFFRAENTRKLKIEGTGLGLAIVKHIINQHGGELKIISKVGLGSEFIVRLPKA